MWRFWQKSPEGQTVLRSFQKGGTVVSRRSNRVEVVPKGWYCSLPKKRMREGGERKKVSRRSKSSWKGKSCRRASEEVRWRVRRAQKVGRGACCRGDGGATGTVVTSGTANAGFKIDHCSKTRVVLWAARLLTTQLSLIHENSQCVTQYAVHRATSLPESSQYPVQRVRTNERVKAPVLPGNFRP